jgi:hypothetical protein
MKLLASKADVVFVGLLVVLGTAFSPLIADDSRNYLVILVGTLTLPIMFIARLMPWKDIPWIAPAILYPFVVSLRLDGTDNITTVLYTGLFACTYMAVAGALQTGRVRRELAVMLLRRLLYMYAIVSLAQFFASQLGLPVPNEILTKGGISYNSLAVEPSHAARFLAMTFVTYALVAGNGKIGLADLFRHHKSALAAFIVSATLTGSALAAIALPISILLSLSLRWQIAGVVGLILLWPALSYLELESVHRSVAFLSALPDMDIRSLTEADQSASVRVLPILIWLDKLSIAQPDFWFGGGLQAIRVYIEGELLGTNSVMAGFWPGYIISFGVVGTALFLVAFAFRFLSFATYPVVLVWLLLFTTSAWNVQFFWYGLLLIRIAHHFRPVTQGRRTFARTGSYAAPPQRHAP